MTVTPLASSTAPRGLAAIPPGGDLAGMNPRSATQAYPSQPPETTSAPGQAPADGAEAARAADRELLRRMAAGDEGALGELYDRWHALLHSLATQIVGDADDAEEVLEEAFWQAWRQAARYDESRGSVSTWLTTILRSRALDRARSRRRLREQVMDELPEPAPDAADWPPSDGGPMDAAAQAERRAIVARALAQLPPEQRQTVEMAYFGGLSQSEIATATGQPLGTVKTRARLALQKLREALAVLKEELP